MKMTKAQLEAELHKATVHLVDMETKAEEDKATCLQFERELAEAHDSLNGAQARINQLVGEARGWRGSFAALEINAGRLAEDVNKFRDMGLVARLLWALKGGAP